MSDKLQRKIDQLQSHIEKASCPTGKSSKCMPVMLIGAAAIPVVAAAALYFISPSFVKTDDGMEKVLSKTKVLCWTIAITLLLWAVMYGYSFYGGVEKMGNLCSV